MGEERKAEMAAPIGSQSEERNVEVMERAIFMDSEVTTTAAGSEIADQT